MNASICIRLWLLPGVCLFFSSLANFHYSFIAGDKNRYASFVSDVLLIVGSSHGVQSALAFSDTCLGEDRGDGMFEICSKVLNLLLRYL